jgi:hypothetical protein
LSQYLLHEPFLGRLIPGQCKAGVIIETAEMNQNKIRQKHFVADRSIPNLIEVR